MLVIEPTKQRYRHNCRKRPVVQSRSSEFDSPRANALSKIKAEVMRIGTNGTRQGFKFAQEMFEKYPELRGA